MPASWVPGRQLRNRLTIWYATAITTGLLLMTGCGALWFVVREHRAAGAESTRTPEVRALIARRDEHLRDWFVGSLPLAVFAGVVVGRFLSRRALRPMGRLGDELELITSGEFETRLPAATQGDEFDLLATRINAVLDRLDRSRTRNRSFVLAAAHRVKTPLTLINGEVALALAGARETGEYRIALHRIAAIGRRLNQQVEELLLRARVEAGERPAMYERVELDGVVLAAVDDMRGRAQELKRRITLDMLEPAFVVGDPLLLRDAALELLENACRHGTPDEPVAVALTHTDAQVVLSISSTGAPLPDLKSLEDAAPDAESATGHGLVILRWIASVHKGTLQLARDGDRNVFRLVFPPAPDSPG